MTFTEGVNIIQKRGNKEDIREAMEKRRLELQSQLDFLSVVGKQAEKAHYVN